PAAATSVIASTHSAIVRAPPASFPTRRSSDLATPGQSFNVTVTARDAQGQPFTGYTGTVHFTSSDTSAGVVLPPDSTLTNGVGTFPVTLVKTGTQTLTSDDAASSLSTTVSVNV